MTRSRGGPLELAAAAWRNPPTTYERHFRRDTAAALLGTSVLIVCMVVVRSGGVSEAEEAVFHAINGLPDWLRVPLWFVQIFGMLAFVALAALAAFAMRRVRLGVALSVLIPLKLMFEWWVVKALVERERPAFTVPDAIIRETNSAPLGFPSGHAVFVFALAGLLAPYLGRRGTYVVYAIAVLAVAARVYLGAHNPLDVIAGAGLGAAIGAGLNLALGTATSPRRPGSTAA